jgi:hypothetical protein
MSIRCSQPSSWCRDDFEWHRADEEIKTSSGGGPFSLPRRTRVRLNSASWLRITYPYQSETLLACVIPAIMQSHPNLTPPPLLAPVLQRAIL